MKILHLYKDYHPVLGGIENHIKELAEGQAALGHQVTVLVCNPSYRTEIETMNGVEVIKAGRLTTQFSMPISLSQPYILATLKPDIVHIQSPYPLGELANWLGGRAQATVISYQSDIVKQKYWLYFYGPILRQVLQATDRIILSTPRYAEISPWLQPVRAKCTVISPGINIERFSPTPRPLHRPPTIMFAGRLRYYKSLSTLLHALTHLPGVRLLVVGDGPMRQPWEQLAQELGIAERVTFVGEVNDEELAHYYQQADVFVLPSNSKAEAYGIVLLEAMASGLPCISTELGTGTSWIVQHGVTGLVVPPETPQLMAAAINILITNEPLRQQFGQAAFQRVQTMFTKEVMTQRVLEVYSELLSSKKKQ